MPEILFRSPTLAVLDKPANVSLLADRSGAPSLWDSLPELLGGKPYLVHRLDKGTSGVLLIALDPATQRRLTRAFQARQVRKFYLARVLGEPGTGRTWTVDLPLQKGRKSRYRVAGARERIHLEDGRWSLRHSHGNGFDSLTRFRVVHGDGTQALIVAAPATGRTHQLRVHLSWIGHPIVGDRLYGRPGDPAQRADRLMLHCHRLVVPEFGAFTASPGDGFT